MKAPSFEDMAEAVDVLRHHEAMEEGGFEGVSRVAAWLEAKVTEHNVEERWVSAIVEKSKEDGKPVSPESARTFYRRNRAKLIKGVR